MEPISLLIRTKNFYQQNPPGTLKVVLILLNPTEFDQKIDFLIKVPDVTPSTVKKMRSLKTCRIKKIRAPSEQTFWDRQLCFYVKKLFVSEKTEKSELCHFSDKIYVIKFFTCRTRTHPPGAKFDDINLLRKMTTFTFLCFFTNK